MLKKIFILSFGSFFIILGLLFIGCSSKKGEKESVIVHTEKEASSTVSVYYNTPISTDADPAKLNYPESKMVQFYGNTWMRNEQFTGRKRELDKIDALLNTDASNECIALTGLAGMGKSQTANEYLYKAMESNKFDAAIWVDASNMHTIVQSYINIAKDLNKNILKELKNLSNEELISKIHDQLSGEYKSLLVILDNFNGNVTALHQYRTNLYKMWINHHNVKLRIIITSTNSVWEKILTIPLSNFSAEELSHYIDKINLKVGADNINHLSHNSALIAKLHNIVGGLPLVVSQALRYMQDTGVSVDELLTTIAKDPVRILNYPTYVSDNYSFTQLTVLDLAMRQVAYENQNAEKMLYILSFLANNKIPKKIIQKYFKNLDKYQKAYQLLINKFLLKGDGEYYSLHSIIREALKKRAKDANLQHELYNTIIGILFDSLDLGSLDKILLSDLNKLTYSTTIVDYIPHIQTVFDYFQTHDIEESCKDKLLILTHILGEYYKNRRSGELALSICNFNIKHGKDKKFEIIDMINISETYINMGSYDKALPYVTKALQKLGKINAHNKSEYIRLLEIQATINVYSGNYAVAKSQIKEALNMFDNTTVLEYELASLKSTLALVYIFSGDFSTALSILQECDKIFKSQNDLKHFKRIFITNNMGFCKIFLGDLSQAKDLFNESLEIAKIHENENFAAHTIKLTPLTNLGITSLFQGQLQDAGAKLKYVLSETAQFYSDLPIHVFNIINLGYYYYYVREYDKSYKLAQQTEILLKNKTNTVQYILTAMLLHKLYEVKKEYRDSLNYLEKFLASARKKFGGNAHNSVRFFYNKYLEWNTYEPHLSDNSDIDYFNKVLTFNLELLGPQHTEVYKYKYFKALYYINAGNSQKAKEILLDIPLANEEFVNNRNVELIRKAFTLASRKKSD